LSLVTATYRIEKGTPVVYLFTRDKDGNRFIFRDPNFEPYFYIQRQDLSYIQFPEDYKSMIKRIETVRMPMMGGGDLAAKIVTKIPSDVAKLKKWLHNKKSKYRPRGFDTYEADVLFVYRYLIDKDIRNGIEVNDLYFSLHKLDRYIPWDDTYCKGAECPYSSKRVLFLDVETVSESSKQISIIGMWDSFSKQYLQLYWRETKGIDHEYIRYFRDEVSVLNAFIDYIRKIRPDIFVSFTKFDMMVLLRRMRDLKIPYRGLSDIFKVYVSSERDPDKKSKRSDYLSIGGIEYIDLQEVYEKVEGGQRFQTLDFISKVVLGHGKIPLKHGSIGETWKRDYRNVLYYNLRDVHLIKQIDRKLKLIDEYLDPIRRKVGCSFNDAMYAARVADISYLRLLHGKMILRTRPVEKVRRRYSGAIVLKAIPGIHDWVVCVDFKSLYPSIIRTFNIGWDTYDASGDISLEGARYVSSTKSWTVQLLEEMAPILDENKRQQKLAREKRDWDLLNALKRRRLAYKSIVNGIYGFFGFPGDPERHLPASRFYSIAIAESITIAARNVLKKSIEICKEIGYEAIMGDTDSLFVKMRTGSENEAEQIRDKIQSRLHDYISRHYGVDPSLIILEIDEIYKRLIVLAKKRYAGKTLDGRKVFKGLEIVRKDQSELTIETQEGLIDLMLNGADKQKIKNFIEKQIRKLDKYPLEKIGIAVTLTKPRTEYTSMVIQLKAMEFANQILDLDIQEGERFFYVPIKEYRYKPITVIVKLKEPLEINKKDPKTDKNKIIYHITKTVYSDVAGFREASDLEKASGIIIDRDRLLERTIKKKTEDLLALIGLSWNEVMRSARGQTSISSFFGR